MGRIVRSVSEADVIERVLEGLRLQRIDTDSKVVDLGLGLRVWLGGVTWTAVQVSVLFDDDPAAPASV